MASVGHQSSIPASSAHLFQRLGNIYFSAGQENYAKALLIVMQFYIYNQDIHLYFMIISLLRSNHKKNHHRAASKVLDYLVKIGFVSFRV